MSAARPGPRAGGSTRRAITAWPWHSRCWARCRGRTCGSERGARGVPAGAALREGGNWVRVQRREAVAGVPGGVGVAGGDMGRVVFPAAPVKVFLTAGGEEGARRGLARRGSRIDPAE